MPEIFGYASPADSTRPSAASSTSRSLGSVSGPGRSGRTPQPYCQPPGKDDVKHLATLRNHRVDRDSSPDHKDSKTRSEGKESGTSSSRRSAFVRRASRTSEDVHRSRARSSRVAGQRRVDHHPKYKTEQDSKSTDQHSGDFYRQERRSYRPHRNQEGATASQSSINPNFSRTNTSLTSLLSSLTGVTDQSSGSTSTITQQSYDLAIQELNQALASTNVFDYMMPKHSSTRKRQMPAHISPSSSTYSTSEAGSSEGPGTPSSRSSAPSPTLSRFKSGPDSRTRETKSIPERSPSDESGRGQRKGPQLSKKVSYAPATVRDAIDEDQPSDDETENDGGQTDYDGENHDDHDDRQHSSDNDDDDDDDDGQGKDHEGDADEADGEHSERGIDAHGGEGNPNSLDPNHHEEDDRVEFFPMRDSYSSLSSHKSQRPRRSRSPVDRMHSQEELRRAHMAYAMKAQRDYIHPAHLPRPQSAASMNSSQADPGMSMAMLQRWPSNPAAPLNGQHSQQLEQQLAASVQPSVPDPPSLSQTTVTGYEKIALAISSDQSGVRPLYRKFHVLNQRILLHLQDELAELEEQLRIVDEVIAQLERGAPDALRVPASRRGETYSQSEIHHRRIHILGRIFTKTEQYNRALSAFSALCRESSTASSSQIEAYRLWMSNNAPVHEVETRFLNKENDLILLDVKPQDHVAVPNATASSSAPSQIQAALAYFPVALMTPLLLFPIVPSFGGRLVVTALITSVAFLVGSATELRHLMPVREYAICGVAYVLLMGAIALCVPSH